MLESEVPIREMFEVDGGYQGVPGSDDVLEGGSEVVDDELYTPGWCEIRILQPLLFCFVGSRTKPLLKDRQWIVLGIACYCTFISSYDWEILPLSLTSIQRDLAISDENIGLVWSIVRLGKVVALLLASLGDIYGRRALLVTSLGMYIIFACATSLSWSFVSFTAFQLITGAFMSVQGTLCGTLILEELDSDNRGWGIGLYNSLSALGGGVAVLLFAVFGGLSGGWRVLYAICIVQILFFRKVYKLLPESQAWLKRRRQMSNSFESRAREAAPWSKYTAPLRSLFVAYPARVAACSLVSFCSGFASAPADLYRIDYMQTVHHLTPPEISLLINTSGLLAFLSFAYTGKLSDTYGRKGFIIAFNLIAPVGTILYYTVPGNWFILFYFIQLQAGFVLSVVNGAYFGECFSTSYRSTAMGWFEAVRTIAAALSMLVERYVFLAVGNHFTSSAIIAAFGFSSSLIVALCLPETSRLELDEISPEQTTE